MSVQKSLLAAVAALVCGASLAQSIPLQVSSALARANVPLDAVTLLVVDAEGRAPARLSHRTQMQVNPASVMKLVTTYAGLDLLGPAYTWATPVFIEGAVREGTLFGNLVIKGQGDPKLVAERLWLLLRRVQGLGIDKIAGDIVLDRSAFEALEADPASFDGEPLRPYNAAPDALLLNYKSLVMTFTPDRTTNFAQVQFDPPLAGVAMQATVPLIAASGDCGDYRGALKADFSDPSRIRFTGAYPANCGEKVWPVAYADPKSYSARAVQGMWLEMGGKLGGAVVLGSVPAAVAAAKPAFEKLRTLATSEDEMLATVAVWAAVKIEPGDASLFEMAIPALRQAIRGDREIVRLEAAVALGEIGPAAVAAIPILELVAEEDPVKAVRAAAAEALTRIKLK